MAGSSLLTLLDDIATLLDDISVMGKLAAKKTAGVLGDDLSLNAQQVAGVKVNRELPVVWKVAKGSLLNKVILVPLALLISAWLPWLITPLLMIGGAYLCYEGFEKLVHTLHRDKGDKSPEAREKRILQVAEQDALEFEDKKVKGAVRTDFILSAEIVAITLGVVSQAPLINQVMVLSGIALLVTVGVYGIVAAIVKLDDLGYWLQEKQVAVARYIGAGLLAFAPLLMKTLSVIGTVAMFLVGGGIIVHGLTFLHHMIDFVTSDYGVLMTTIISTVANLLMGVLVGAAVLFAVKGISRMKQTKSA
ncbi:MAG: Inner membrane protein YedI [Candidatus Erwinia impunctatus]|nr:Inner membrane protein YedI [Culicoides impunctatus]